MHFEILYPFLTVAQQGSISAAARKLHIAQPALSKQMQQLEEALGCTLLIRGSRRIRLTEAGKALCSRTEHLKQFENSLRSEMKEYASGGSGLLRIGITPYNASVLLPSLMEHFTALYPAVRLEINEVPTEQILNLLREGIAEVGIVKTQFAKNGEFAMHGQTADPLIAVWHKDFPFTPSAEPLTLQALANTPICVTRSFEDLFKSYCAQADFMPNIVCSSSQTGTTLLLAQLKKGVGIVPCSVLHGCTDLHSLPFEETYMNSPTALISLAENSLSMPAQNFISVCKELFFR